MATAKRLYLYAVSGAALALGLSGAAILLRTLINNIGVGPQGGTVDADKDQLAMGLGLLVAGLIVWLIHWNLVERMVADVKDEKAIAERRSIVRAVFFALVLAVTLWVAATELAQLVARMIGDIVGAKALSVPESANDSMALATILVAAAAWAYHAWIRDRDLRTTPLISGAAAWVSRLYLYGAALVGVIIALDMVVVVIKTIVSQWAEAPVTGPLDSASMMGVVPTSVDWVRPVIVAIIAAAVWAGVWAAHWLYSLRLRTGTSQQASAERGSRTRLAFLVLVIVWATATIVINLSSGLGQLLARLIDADPSKTPTWYLVFLPIAVAVPAAIALWWHRLQALVENVVGGVPNVSAVRVILYSIALVGLAELTAGAAQALQALVLQIFTSAPENAWKVPVALGVAAMVVGGVVWAWPWLLAQARRIENNASEIVSSSRSYYLYFVLGVSVIVGAVSLAVLVYEYSRILLSLKDPTLAVSVAPALAAGIVAAVVIAYHFWVLRTDPIAPVAKPAPAPVAATAAVAKAVSATAAAAAKAPAKAPAKKPAAKKPAAKKPAAKPATRTATPK